MNYEYVEVQTEQNITLFGFMQKKEGNKKCILYIPGLAGNFFESKFARIFGNLSIDKGYDFLFSHNQGSFQIMDFQYLREDGKIKSKTKGSAFERFEDSKYDIKAWIEYIKTLGYEKIILLCHSMGCNKIVYYLNQHSYDELSNVILLAPQDNVNFKNLEMHEGLLEEAKRNIDLGQSDKLLSKKFLGFCVMSSQTYYDEITNPVINNIPYKTVNGDFSMLKNINLPTFVLIGTDDGGDQSLEYMKKVASYCLNGKYDVVEGANHNFKNKEIKTSEKIFNYLEEN